MNESMTITIRRATPEDAAALARLAQPVQQLHVDHHPDQFAPISHDALAKAFRAQLELASVSAWVAEADRHIVGYALGILRERPEAPLIQPRRWYEFDQLVVDPAWRRIGIARSLAEAVALEAAARGTSTIELNVWAFNGPAQRLFEQLGFAPSRLRLERHAP